MKETAIHVTEVVEATPPTDGAAVGAQSTAVQPVEESESKKDPRTDAMLLDQFIKERCANSENTATSYRSMIRRLAKFCQYNGMRSMREFQRDQWPQYAAYLASPPAEHIMQRSLPLDHKKWQPFRGPLSPASRNLAQIVAKSFFEWMSDPAIGAIEINPVASVRAKRVRRSASAESIDRFIPEDCMPYVEAALARMYGDDHVDGKNRDEVRYRMRARARWIIDLGLLTGLRASEMALADSSMIRPGTTAGTMSLHIRRKGGVQAKMPLMPEVIEGYKRYLAAYGLTWQRTIALPLVMPARLGTAPVINGQVAVKHSTRNSIWRIVKDVMRAAAAEANASDDPTAAHRLESASTHWLRHTFATSLLDAGGDIRVARDLLDHGDISTTSRYTHTVETQMRGDLKKLSDRLQRRGDKPG